MSEQNIVLVYHRNRRQAYKNQKLQQSNEIYYCECGKNYLTFSALYLHARNKHDIKLTTKRNDSLCRVQKKSQKTIITYFINPIPTQSHNKQQSIQLNQNSIGQKPTYHSMIAIVNEYLHQHSKNVQSNATCQVIAEFKKYLLKIQTLFSSEEMPMEPSFIPHYFNDFIVCYLPQCHREGIISVYTLALAEASIINFWRWLKQKQYTSSQLLHKSTSPIQK